ncbi:MAG: hypothetical protein LBG13_03590 [Holosporales bacterium]|jgi:Fe-S cluster assembly iron-binding protein IscA|nr:hypothetical protein [Holosporales bacterium]
MPPASRARVTIEMIINIDEETALFLKRSCFNEEIVTISIVEAGCSGNMLSIGKANRHSLGDDFSIYDVSSGLSIAISKDVPKVTGNITVYKKQGLLAEIIVLNNDAVSTCRCGKSFQITK